MLERLPLKLSSWLQQAVVSHLLRILHSSFHYDIDSSLPNRLEEAAPRTSKIKFVKSIFGALSTRQLFPLDRGSNNLWSVALDFDTACMSSMQWLCGCPKLVELKVDISRLEDFSDFLPILHRLSALKDFTIKWRGDVELLPSPVPISTVIANYPSSLQAFKAAQFVFFDLLKKFTKREIPHGKDVAALKYIWVRTSELGMEGSSEEVVLWGEEHDGKVRWSCLEEEPDQET
ncbi:hypothetical protein JCM5350_008319 [Sporobolomyces pararoseus]